MRCRLFTLLVTIMSCAVVTGCSTSQWVTDTRAEFIREGTKTVVRPVLSIVRYPEDKPELIVQLSQELSGQRVLEEHKHEEIHKIWEPNIGSFSIGLLGLAASPFYMVGSTLGGQPAVGFKMLKSSALTIVGFEGIDQQDRRGESAIEVTPMGIGTEIIPWGNAPVDLFVERMPPIKKWTDQTGKLVVDLKVLPMDIVHPKKDLHLTVSTEANGVAVRENVTITVATVMSWPAKAAEFARKEQERLVQIARQEQDKKEQEERQAVAKREREAQEAREARARAEYERQHPEIARAREAEAAAQQQCAQCKSSCDSQALGCTAACFGNLADTMCSGRCQVALNTCKNGCEEQRDALIVQAGGTPLGTSNSGTAALFQGLVAMGDSLAAAKGRPSSGARGSAAAMTPPNPASAQSGNLALEENRTAARDFSASRTREFPAAAAPPRPGSTHSCPTSLAHLAPKLPQYDVPDLQRARSAILQLSTTEMYQRMLNSGITPANGAKMAIQDVEKVEQQREVAKQCVRQTAANPESVISALERGTYRSPTPTASGVLDGCARGYVLMHYQAVATKAAAVAIACMARQ